MPLVKIPEEFLSKISKRLMTYAVYYGDEKNNSIVDKNEHSSYNKSAPSALNGRLKLFRSNLLTEDEFVQAIVDNNLTLLRQKNYTAEQLNDRLYNYKFSKWNGYRPLDIALYLRHTEIAKQFIKENAPLNDIYDSENTSPISAAAFCNDLDLIKMIVEKAPETINKADKNGWTTLHSAVIKGIPGMVEYLVDHGAKMTATNRDVTPFTLALDYDHIDIATWLFLKNPKDIGYFFSKIKNPLSCAVRANALELVKLILEQNDHGMETRNVLGLTPLHEAVRDNHPEMVELLIERGANINTKDDYDNSLFHSAAKNKNAQAVLNSLIKAQASILEKNKEGKSAIDIAHEAGRLENKAIMLKYIVESDKENALEKQAKQIVDNAFSKSEQQNIAQQQEKIIALLTQMQNSVNENKDSLQKLASKVNRIEKYLDEEKERHLKKADKKYEPAKRGFFNFS